MISSDKNELAHCLTKMLPIRDALEVVNGKWKMLILIAIMQGNRRFKDIEQSIPKLSSKVLASELKALETHQLIRRTVQEDLPASVEYMPTEYGWSLEKVMLELHDWGAGHRKKMMGR